MVAISKSQCMAATPSQKQFRPDWLYLVETLLGRAASNTSAI